MKNIAIKKETKDEGNFNATHEVTEVSFNKCVKLHLLHVLVLSLLLSLTLLLKHLYIFHSVLNYN